MTFTNRFAIITGAAQGLGKSYALNLAKHGISGLIINDIEKEKLKLLDVKKEVEKRYNCKVEVNL